MRSRSIKSWSITAPSIAKLPETLKIASDRSIHRSTSWPDNRNNSPGPLSVVPHFWTANALERHLAPLILGRRHGLFFWRDPGLI